VKNIASHLLLALVVVLSGACGREDTKAYRVPKEQPSPPDVPAGHPDISSSAPQLNWKLPDGWQEVPAGDFRVASFKITGKDGAKADVSVIPLPGDAGGDFSNVNRWRGQVGLEPVSPEDFARLTETIEVAGQTAHLYDQAGDSSHILAAIQQREDTTWFFKMTGDNQLVAQQKPVLVEFLKSLQFASGQSMAGSPAGHPDISTAPAPAPAVAVSSQGRPTWNTPTGWQEVPGGQFLVAKFAIAGGGGGQAAVNVSTSPGNGGGLAANVNRWRKQLGLGELGGDELAKSVTTVSDQIAVVEMSGERASLVGAIVSLPGQTWFYKLMGDQSVVAEQKEGFTKFVQEVKY
jgi:hypothetical protein